MKSAAVGLISSSCSPIAGHSILNFSIFSITSSTVLAQNGRHPTIISYAITPKLHQSILRLSRLSPLIISGAIQSGVPIIFAFFFPSTSLDFFFYLNSPGRKVVSYSYSYPPIYMLSLLTFLILSFILISERPKSVNFKCLISSNMRFSGFRSL